MGPSGEVGLIPMKKNQEFMSRLKRLECPNATYESKPPLVMSRGQGSKVVDAEGHSYIDLCAGFGVLALGHAHPEIQKTIRRFCEKDAPITHAMGDVYPSEEKVELLEKLVEFAPKRFTHAALAISGGQAVELAMKTAMLVTKAKGFVGFNGGYHGLDLGLLGLTAREDFRAPFLDESSLEQFRHVDFGADLSIIEQAIIELKNSRFGFAAVVVEPLQGRGGMRLAERAWIHDLKELCDQYGGLLIFDEVFTGFGRCGRTFFAEEWPCDLICVGKALGGGMPLSACLGTSEVMNAWPASRGEALHTGTFFGHPLSCAVASRTLQLIVELSLVQRSEQSGAWLRTLLSETLLSHPNVREIRGEGLMVGIEFTQKGMAAILSDRLRSRGLIILPSGDHSQVLSLTPALTISREELREAVQMISAELKVL